MNHKNTLITLTIFLLTTQFTQQACLVLNCMTCSPDPNICLVCGTGYSNEKKKTTTNKNFSICKKNAATWWKWLLAALTLGGLGALGLWLFKKKAAADAKKKLGPQKQKAHPLPYET
jgi:hypothetical protein